MKKGLTLFIFSFFIISQLISQNEKALEHGVLLSSRIDSDDNFKFDINGFGIESGYFILNHLSERISISLDFRLAYSQRDQKYDNAVSPMQLSYSLDTIRLVRNGEINYKNLSLSIPVKFRFKLSQDNPIFLLAGTNPYINIWTNAEDNYDEIEFDRINNLILSEKIGEKGRIKQKFVSTDLILIGFGYKKNKIMADVYFSAGAVNLNHDFIQGLDKFSIVFNIYYKLN